MSEEDENITSSPTTPSPTPGSGGVFGTGPPQVFATESPTTTPSPTVDQYDGQVPMFLGVFLFFIVGGFLALIAYASHWYHRRMLRNLELASQERYQRRVSGSLFHRKQRHVVLESVRNPDSVFSAEAFVCPVCLSGDFKGPTVNDTPSVDGAEGEEKEEGQSILGKSSAALDSGIDSGSFSEIKLTSLDAAEQPSGIVKTTCGHHFHRSCLEEWLNHRDPTDSSLFSNDNCPSCRTTIVELRTVL